ncbi:acid-sensing ion channel 2, partial [Exaiptasia diaphana]|uniref:Uncharacterized protein n=1 Tax=Exaiptasia diaphana TaxID=2652724 RepID=A0A913WUV0_EXADI
MPNAIDKSSQLVTDFAGYSTLHGFHFVLGLHAPIRRLLWLCLILSCVSFLVVQLVLSYQKLSAHRHVLDRDVVPSKSLTFPAFTLCNINMMKRSMIDGTDAQLYLDKLDPVKASQVVNKTLSSSFDLKKAVLEYGHTASEMIKLCTWNGKICSYKNFTTSFSYTYGLCHTFNLGDNEEELLNSTSNQRDLGLILMIDINDDEYYGPISYLSTGIKVVVHDQKEHPMVDEFGDDVMPGFTTSIKIKREKFHRLKHPYSSACGSKKLVTSNEYVRSICILECNTREMIKKRGCRLLGMPNLPEFNTTGYCNPSEIISDVVTPRASNCDCPLPCEEI